MPSIEVIINAAGGSFVEGETERILDEAFAANGLEVKIRLAETGEQIGEFADAAIKSDAQIIVAGGGDGTLSSVAGRVAESGKTFGILPLGTLNHFSRDLGISQNVADAVKTIAENHTVKVDLAAVNDRIFVNNSSIGLYPRIVHNRELQQDRLGRGKWSAALIAALKVLRRNSFFRVSIKTPEREFSRRTPFVFIGNNEYEMDLYNIGKRTRLDAGKLSVYILCRGGRSGVLWLLVRTVFGRLKQAREFEAIETGEITIATGKKQVLVALDGEVVVMESPLQYRVMPGALTVIVPRPKDDDA